MDRDKLKDKIKAAFIMRCAGCTLGAPVEGYAVADMEKIAAQNGDAFPPDDYWTDVPDREAVRYGISPRKAYTRGGMHGVPVDDDTVYTLLNLLLLERYGAEYTVDDVGKLWLELLPYACTAEDEALKALKRGVEASRAAEGNDYVEWIGAAIRGDAFGYARAGRPEEACALCVHDARLTHRENGIYGEMFTSAAVAAAFTAQSPLDAARTAAEYIPDDCELKKQLDWAFSHVADLTDYKSARRLLDARFPGLNGVHTINNMCAVVFSLALGGKSASACIGNAVAIGLDNDCNAATAGSIAGAWCGMSGVEEKWYIPFAGRVLSYIKGYGEFDIDDVAERFTKLNG